MEDLDMINTSGSSRIETDKDLESYLSIFDDHDCLQAAIFLLDYCYEISMSEYDDPLR